MNGTVSTTMASLSDGAEPRPPAVRGGHVSRGLEASSGAEHIFTIDDRGWMAALQCPTTQPSATHWMDPSDHHVTALVWLRLQRDLINYSGYGIAHGRIFSGFFISIVKDGTRPPGGGLHLESHGGPTGPWPLL